MTTLQARICFLISCCISFLSLNAQDYSVQSELIGTELGLSGVTTYSIEKDQNGFIWVSTSNGLDRYDGSEFQFYGRDQYYYDDNVIANLVKNADHELWLLGINFNNHRWDQIKKVSIFNTQTKKPLSKPKLDSIQKNFDAGDYSLVKNASNLTQIFFTNQQGQLWTHQSGSLLRLPVKCPGTVKSISKYNNGFRLAAQNELLTYDEHWTLLSRVEFPGPIFGFWTSAKGQTWVATKNVESEEEHQIWEMNESMTYQPYYLKDEAGKRIRLDLTVHEGYYIYRSKAGFWILNLKGEMLVFDPDGNQIENILEYLDFIGPIRFNDLVETEDLILVSTDMGIVELKVNIETFKTIYTKSDFSDSRGIVESTDGTLLFSEDQLYGISSLSHLRKSIYPETTGFGMYCTDSLLLLGNGYDVNHSIFVKNLRTGQIDYYPPFDHSVVYCFAPTSDPNQFWIGCENGIGLVDLLKKDTLHFKQFNEFSELKSSKVKFIHQNALGNWLATDRGVFLLDEKYGVLKQFNQTTGDLPFNDINHIYEDINGLFWLATNGAGIIRWELSSDNNWSSSFLQYDVSSGLSHNIVYSIYEDSRNRLWISSNRGIVCMDKSSYQTKVFLEEDGLPHAEFNLTSHYQARDSALYFGGLGGLVRFYPNDLELSFQTDIPLALTSFEALNDETLASPDLMAQFKKKQEIKLSRTTFLEIKFQLLDFSDNENHLYLYKIEGITDQWTKTESNNIRIASLPYGHYKLHIKGGNINTGWSNQVLTILLSVPKPFYLRNWFFSVLFLMAGLLTWSFIKFRTRQLNRERTRLAQKVIERTEKIEADKIIIEQQAQKLAKLDQLKTDFFTNITHELRTPLSLILGPASQLVKEEKQSPENQKLARTIYNNTQNLLGLTKELLDLAQMEAGTLDLEKTTINLQEFLNEIIDTYQGFADYQQIRFSPNFNFPRDLYLEVDAKKVEKIINNLLSNAFKFTSAQGEVYLHTLWTTGFLNIEIRDTGKGIDPKMQPFIFDRYFQCDAKSNQLGVGGAGIGLAICKEYLLLMGGTIKVESQHHHGATFRVRIPAPNVPAPKLNKTGPTKIIESKATPKQAQVKMETLTSNVKFRILIAEDNAELAIYLQNNLSKFYDIQLVQNGLKAWQILQKERFDLVISDVMMPEMNGIELLTKFKTNPEYRKIPFIMLTALVESKDRIEALRIGVDDYLHKPFLIEELEIRIEKLLKRSTIRNNKDSNTSVSLSADENWLKNLEATTSAMISDPDFTVRELANSMNISERSLFNRLRALVGVTPGAYIREIRLNYARELLEQKKYNTVAEVCYAVGFQKPSYFTQVFKKRYGCLPSKFFK